MNATTKRRRFGPARVGPGTLARVRRLYLTAGDAPPPLPVAARRLGISRSHLVAARSLLIESGELTSNGKGGRPEKSAPTPAEIAERCAEIRAGWGPERFAARPVELRVVIDPRNLWEENHER